MTGRTGRTFAEAFVIAFYFFRAFPAPIRLFIRQKAVDAAGDERQSREEGVRAGGEEGGEVGKRAAHCPTNNARWRSSAPR